MTGESHEAEYGLVVPFVLTRSHDGPFDDEAFTIGWLCGTVDAELNAVPASAPRYERPVQTVALAQLDLVAMRHGFVMASEPWDEAPDEWSHAVFERAPASEVDDD